MYRHLVSGTDLLKSPITAKQDGNKRLLFIEPSADVVDHQGEVVDPAGLWNDRDYYLEKGNIDYWHLSWMQPRDGVRDPDFYDIGRPLEVRGNEKEFIVIAEIARGSEMADKVWRRMTEREPPIRYYPSVGAKRRGTKSEVRGGQHVQVTTKVLWTNIALCKEPVNPAVPPVRILNPKEYEVISGSKMLKAMGGLDIITPGVDLEYDTIQKACVEMIGHGDVQKVLDTLRNQGINDEQIDFLLDEALEIFASVQ
jgi:hypothetical protein